LDFLYEAEELYAVNSSVRWRKSRVFT
jgi:hypothetical protein